MPMSEETAMKIVAVSRTAYSVVVVKGASRRGCLICTAMNSRPPVIAATAAAFVSVLVVMAISCSLVLSSAAQRRSWTQRRNRRGDEASPDDVIERVIRPRRGRLQQAAFAGPEHRGPSAGDAEFGENVLGVAAERVAGDEQLAGD